MSRSIKLFLGASTLVPMVLTGYLLLRLLSSFWGVADSGGAVSTETFIQMFHELLGVLAITVGSSVALLCACLWHLLVHSARRGSSSQTALWALALLFLSILAMPIYWFAEVWPEGEGQQARLRRA